MQKIVSGGQTGVDRAALDAALEHGVPIGGWCPRGRRAEDGQLAARYPLQETPATDYAQRTAWNVRDSDGTLILVAGAPEGGTALTVEEARRRKKPFLQTDVEANGVNRIHTWLRQHDVAVLNVAGPRASEAPGIYEAAYALMMRVLEPAPTMGK
ncbi:MAG: molybdenum cofactor carrier [Bacteroidetes bacterium]|nr:molybdenum cofactor carrier [Bacteroidota bacterium]